MDAKQVLAQTPIFKDLSKEHLETLSREARERKYKAGETILREGERGIAFFAIASGNVEVLRGSGADQNVVNHLGPGDSFGEMALLSESARTATVRTVSDVECVAITRLDFIDALREQPEISIHLLKTMSEMLHKAEERADAAQR